MISQQKIDQIASTIRLAEEDIKNKGVKGLTNKFPVNSNNLPFGTFFVDELEIEPKKLCSEMDYIPSYFFYGCEKLNDIELFGNIKRIELSAFSHCEHLFRVLMIANYEIPSFCFSECIILHKIVIRGNCRYIHKDAFRNCERLEEIYIPKTCEGIDDNAFSGCNNYFKIYSHNPNLVYNGSDGNIIYIK